MFVGGLSMITIGIEVADAAYDRANITWGFKTSCMTSTKLIDSLDSWANRKNVILKLTVCEGTA